MFKKKYSKKLIAFIVFANVVFATAVFAVFWHTGNEPTALVAAWFGFTTVELWNLATIKKTEVHHENERKDI